MVYLALYSYVTDWFLDYSHCHLVTVLVCQFVPTTTWLSILVVSTGLQMLSDMSYTLRRQMLVLSCVYKAAYPFACSQVVSHTYKTTFFAFTPSMPLSHMPASCSHCAIGNSYISFTHAMSWTKSALHYSYLPRFSLGNKYSPETFPILKWLTLTTLTLASHLGLQSSYTWNDGTWRLSSNCWWHISIIALRSYNSCLFRFLCLQAASLKYAGFQIGFFVWGKWSE